MANYYLINFNEGDIDCWNLKATLNEKWKINPIFNSQDKTGNKPRKGDKVIILQSGFINAKSESGQSCCSFKAAGVFINNKEVEILKDYFVFDNIKYNKNLRLQLFKSQADAENHSIPTNEERSRVYELSDADYKIFEDFLKTNHESRNFYYFGLGKADEDFFITGDAKWGKRNPDGAAILGLKSIKLDKFYDTNRLKPKCGDFSLMFAATGTRNEKQPSKYFGKITTVSENENCIKFDIVKVDEIMYRQMRKNAKLSLDKFSNVNISAHFKPFPVSKEAFEKMLTLCLPLLSHHNIVFNGAPGTGKTHMAKQIAKMLDARMKFVQFHPSYDYTDFVEGLRPVVNTANDTIGFERRDGHFKEFCAEAAENMAASMGKKIDWKNGTLDERTKGKEDLKKFVFIIDEINRGDMSKIFGELFYSIECGYRVSSEKLADAIDIKKNSEYAVQTQYHNLIKDGEPFKNGFFVPDNVYIIGTMNDIDRSVESMDFAMRRRFTFIEITPEEAKGMLYGKLTLELANEAVKKMDAINKIISEEIGSEYQIGPAYFLDLKDDSDFESLWEQRIKPLIKEYRRGEDKDDNKNLFEKLKNMWDNPTSEIKSAQ